MELISLNYQQLATAPEIIQKIYLKAQNGYHSNFDVLIEAEEKHPRYFKRTIYDRIPVPIYHYNQLNYWRNYLRCKPTINYKWHTVKT